MRSLECRFCGHKHQYHCAGHMKAGVWVGVNSVALFTFFKEVMSRSKPTGRTFCEQTDFPGTLWIPALKSDYRRDWSCADCRSVDGRAVLH